jgi:TonB family protein
MSKCISLAAFFWVLIAAPMQARPITDTTNPYYGSDYEKAHFPGGSSALKQYIKMNTRYPEDYRESGVQGRTVVRFLVDEQGKVSGITIIKGIGLSSDAEAKCIVGDMPAWVPATYKKRPVPSVQLLKIDFKLE